MNKILIALVAVSGIFLGGFSLAAATSVFIIQQGGTATSSAVTNGVYYYNGTNAEADSLLSYTNAGGAQGLSVTGIASTTNGLYVNGTFNLNTASNPAGNGGMRFVPFPSSSAGFISLNGPDNNGVANQLVTSASLHSYQFVNSGAGGFNVLIGNSTRQASGGTSELGINATSTPSALLSIAGLAGGTTPLFMLSTSTAAFATSTVFKIGENGNVYIIGGGGLNVGYGATVPPNNGAIVLNNVGIGTSTPGTLLSIGATGAGINLGTGTSTFTGLGGINLVAGSGTAGCFAINGTCLTSSSGTVTSIATNNGITGGTITTTGTIGLAAIAANSILGNIAGASGVPSAVATSSLFAGSTGQFHYFSAANTLTATSSIFLATSGNIGIGTSTPQGKLGIQSATNAANVVTVANSIGSTTASFSTLDTGATEFSVASSTQATGKFHFAVDARGHILTGGAAPTCGTGCSSVVGDDNNFRAVTGSGVTAVTVNFASTWVNSSGTVITPVCNSSDESGGTTVSDASSTPISVTMNLSASLTTKNLAISCMASDNFTQ